MSQANFKLKPTHSSSTPSLIPANVSTFQRTISADEIDQIRKIELLEKQIDALYVVSKQLNDKEKQGGELLGSLKDKLFSLSNKHELDNQSFTEQFNALHGNLKELAGIFKESLETYKNKHEQDHEMIAAHIDQQITISNENNNQRITSVEKKNKLYSAYLNTLEEKQAKQDLRINSLENTTEKLTQISGKLTEKVSEHEQRFEQVEKVIGDQQNSITELFDQTHDLHQTDQELFAKYNSLQEELNQLEKNHHDLLKSTKDFKEQQQIQSQTVRKTFKFTHLFTTIAFAIIAASGSAYYVSNNQTVDSLQGQSATHTANIYELDLMAKQSINLQQDIQQQITLLEGQLTKLNDDYDNQRIDMATFEQRQDVIGVQLNQLASQVTQNQEDLSEEISIQAKNSAFYKRIQFARKDGAPVYDQAWIDMQSATNYTVQLMSSPVKVDVLNFVKYHDLDGKIAYRESLYKGQVWYSIVTGSHNTKSDAYNAIKLLPTSVMSNKPIVRKISFLKSK
ncbi:MAG: hypothetical protein HQL46_06435 [Gammaproteobacteria bacterium]|nr:hypothetical protein [Gammaproteobacteria bacterium]